MASLTAAEIDQFMTELDGLVRTNAPLPDGLRRFAAGRPAGSQRQFCERLAAGLESGKPFDQAARDSGVRVPPHVIAVLRCMEISGKGSEILDFAVNHGRRCRRHRDALVTAAFYPALVLLVCMGILWLFANFLHPRLVDIFSQLGAELPGATLLAIGLGRLFTGPAGTSVMVLLAAILATFFLVARLRELLIEAIAALPGLDTLVAVGDTAVSMRFVGVMLKGGVPLHVALEAAGFSVALERTRAALRIMSRAAESGQPSAPHLPRTTPATAAWLYRSAEERGDLPETCLGISDYCENTFDRLSVRRLAIFEPLMIVALALFIGFFVISSYLPLFMIPKVIR